MAFVHGKASAYELDNGAGSLQALTAYANGIEYAFTIDTAETTTFGDSAKEYIVGLKDGTFSVSGPWDATVDAHMNGIDDGLTAGGSVSFVLYPAGNSSGLPKYSGECFLTSYSTSSGVGDVVTYSCEFQCTGAVTRGTV